MHTLLFVRGVTILAKQFDNNLSTVALTLMHNDLSTVLTGVKTTALLGGESPNNGGNPPNVHIGGTLPLQR